MLKNDQTLFYQLLVAGKDIIVGVIGGGIGYLLKFSKNREADPEVHFSFMVLLINIIVGGYTAYMFGSLLPASAHYRDFLIGAIGVSSYPILQFIEVSGVKYFIKFVEKTIGIKFEDKK